MICIMNRAFKDYGKLWAVDHGQIVCSATDTWWNVAAAKWCKYCDRGATILGSFIVSNTLSKLHNHLRLRYHSWWIVVLLLNPSSFASLFSPYFTPEVGQVVLKYNRNSGESSSFQFSNFGVLGLPYWFAPPPEKVITT